MNKLPPKLPPLILGGRMVLTAGYITKLLREGVDVQKTDDAPRGAGKLVFRMKGGRAEWLFQFFYQSNRRQFMKLGNANGAGALSLAAAREALEPHRHVVLEGRNPKIEKEREEYERKLREREYSERGTVEQLFQEYVDDMKRRGKSSWEAVERALLTGRHAAVDELGADRKAVEVRPQDIKFLLRRVYERGTRSMATHLRAYLHGAFKYGITNELDYTRAGQDIVYGLQDNPVASVPVDKESKVVGERVLTKAEIKNVWNTMSEHSVSYPVHSAVKLILAMGGQRVGEVLQAKVSEFDLEKRVWNLPGKRTKNGRDHPLPLTDTAIEIIQAVCEGSESEYLFPKATNLNEPKPVTSVGRAVTRFCESSEADHWTPRDIRRTARTMLSDAGEPAYRIDIFLNHGTTVGVGEKHYDKAKRMKDKILTMQKWEFLLLKALGEGCGKVISI